MNSIYFLWFDDWTLKEWKTANLQNHSVSEYYLFTGFIRERYVFLIFEHFFLNVHFWGYDIFSRLVVIQSSRFFSGSTYLLDSCFWWSIFPVKMAMTTKLFRVVKCYEEHSPINMYDTSMEWSCEITWQMKCMSPPAKDVSTSHLASCRLS